MTNGATFVVLSGCAGLLLVDDLSGHGQFNEVQFVALAVAGTVILFVGTFAPGLALAFAGLLGLSILLNSPTGIPFVKNKSKTVHTTSVITPKGTGAALA